uniref:uncharacterized protein LOC109954007 n=1 Tax=Monopterus albus TaxID=43700 RepID=UPI0009B3AF69|nr:uncharacterized protein LOC109954007 [Monopterus albus]
MAAYISHLDVSLDKTDELKLQSRGFEKLDPDLNKGAGGNFIFFWYKKDPSSAPITRIQFTFNEDMAIGLEKAGYTKIDKDLNAGARGDYIYLWYFKGNTESDTPIVGIHVTTDAADEPQKFRCGWERLACDLNRKAGGNWIHTWVKRASQTYICNVTATHSYGADADYFRRGYIRLDEDTNRGADGAFVFIWYRQTTDPQRALTALHISTDMDEYQGLQQQNYQQVSVNLNESTKGNQVYLWYKKEDGQKPIKGITLLFNKDGVPAYVRAGFDVIKRDLNTGNNGWTEYLCVYQ